MSPFLLTHISIDFIFADYISPRLTRLMIAQGSRACFMKDKKGWLPAHVACSRHCSPEKLRMLLAVNPQALFDKTNDGYTLLDLAEKEATKSHPNFALIEELHRQLAAAGIPIAHGEEMVHPNNTATVWQPQGTSMYPYHPQQQDHPLRRPRTKKSKFTVAVPAPSTKSRSSSKRKTSDYEILGDEQPAADMLLHLSRNGSADKSPRGSIHHESRSLPVAAVTTDEEPFHDEHLSIRDYQQQPNQQDDSQPTQVYEI